MTASNTRPKPAPTAGNTRLNSAEASAAAFEAAGYIVARGPGSMLKVSFIAAKNGRLATWQYSTASGRWCYNFRWSEPWGNTGVAACLDALRTVARPMEVKRG